MEITDARITQLKAALRAIADDNGLDDDQAEDFEDTILDEILDYDLRPLP